MSILISLILAIPAYVLWNSNRLASWICIILIVLLLFAGMVWRDDAKAQVNRMNYWSMSGKDRALARRRWEAQADAEEERLRQKAAAKEERKRKRMDKDAERALQKYRKKLSEQKKNEQKATKSTVSSTQAYETTAKSGWYACLWCRQMIQTTASVTQTKNGRVLEFYCPYCRKMNRTPIKM